MKYIEDNQVQMAEDEFENCRWWSFVFGFWVGILVGIALAILIYKL